jgi:excinuclease UvrABC helicase subunit UvrB
MQTLTDLIEDALCRGEVVVVSLCGNGVAWRSEQMIEKQFCRECGCESLNPRFQPITNGLCKRCSTIAENQAKDARLSKLQSKATLKRLNTELEVAIITEDFETAAMLRDKIKAHGG